jgi:hypothetical protein
MLQFKEESVMELRFSDIESQIEQVSTSAWRWLGFRQRKTEAREYMEQLFDRFGRPQLPVPRSTIEFDHYPIFDRFAKAGSTLNGTYEFLDYRRAVAVKNIEEACGRDPELRAVLLSQVASIFDNAVGLAKKGIHQLDTLLAEVEGGRGDWESHGERILGQMRNFVAHNGVPSDYIQFRERAFRAFDVKSFEEAVDRAELKRHARHLAIPDEDIASVVDPARSGMSVSPILDHPILDRLRARILSHIPQPAIASPVEDQVIEASPSPQSRFP